MASLLLLFAVVKSEVAADMRYDRWSWAMPQEPIEYFFRRNQEIMPVKSPSFQCECPPNKECIVEYKINEAAADFLNLRGVMKEDELQNFNQEIKEIKQVEASNAPLPEKHRERRRSGVVPADECCCPPRNVMMPTFITDKRFDKEIERMSNNAAPGEDKKNK